MDISDTSPECNSTSLITDSVFPSTIISNQFALPTITQLYLDLQRWTLPARQSGIFLKPLVSPLKGRALSALMLKKRDGKSAEADELLSGLPKSGAAKLNIPSQAVELSPGFKTMCGARRHAKLRVGKITYTLLLSATNAPKGTWSILEGFEGDRTPILVPFNEQAYMRILLEQFGG